jgi:predicted Zn-dependent protease
LTTTVRMADGSSSGWAGQPSLKLSQIDSAKLASVACGKCAMWKNPQRLDPGNYTVVLEPTAAGDIVRLITSGFSARNTDEGRTFLSKRGGGTLLGEKMFPEYISLHSNPFDGRQPSSPWSGDLLPAKAVTWIDKGVVANLAYDRYWASKTGKEPNGGGGGGRGGGGWRIRRRRRCAHAGRRRSINRVSDCGSRARAADYPLLVYPRGKSADPAADGLTRDGVFLIEHGKVTTPVINFRFLESPVRLLKNTKKLGQSIRVRGLEGGMMVSPALVATDFPLPSISDAI